VPLLLLSLDDTLLDRAGAFRDWGLEFLDRLGAPRYDLDWLLSVDADGMTSYWDTAEAIRKRYGLRTPAIDLVEDIRYGIIERLRFDPLLGCALDIARNAGWAPVVVANGETVQEVAKLKRTGLDQYLVGWIVSEEVGVRKPNPRIFAIAAQRARLRLSTAWMVGDGPETDIQGAVAAGMRSVWLHRGRMWHEPRFGPTEVADGMIAAISIVMAN
jgi:putative hydrolase of the HAD superfamily